MILGNWGNWGTREVPLSAVRASDFVALIKPRITTLVLFTTAAGLWFAPIRPETSLIVYTLIGTVLMVGAANALNMYLERDIDALMTRTMNRPLPAKRMNPSTALWFGITLSLFSVSVLAFGVNLLTAALGVGAFVSYVLFYTPLKPKSHAALLVGAVPGALPPLMGWTAATGSIRMPGLALFFILFLWQIPHFLAIALFRREEYQKAGIRILPLEKGESETKYWIVRYSAGLVAVSFYPVILGMTRPAYLWTAAALGATLFIWACLGLLPQSKEKWARGFFLLSIVYLPILLSVLVATS